MSWHDRDLYGKSRLVEECKAMQESAPDFVLRRKLYGTLFWEGIVKPVKSRFILEIQYPGGFPFEPHGVYVKSPELPMNTPHLYSGQRLCIFHPGYARKVGIYDPGRTTAATMRGHAINWLGAFEYWRVKGIWPVGESPTG